MDDQALTVNINPLTYVRPLSSAIPPVIVKLKKKWGQLTRQQQTAYLDYHCLNRFDDMKLRYDYGYELTKAGHVHLHMHIYDSESYTEEQHEGFLIKIKTIRDYFLAQLPKNVDKQYDRRTWYQDSVYHAAGWNDYVFKEGVTMRSENQLDEVTTDLSPKSVRVDKLPDANCSQEYIPIKTKLF